MEAPKTHAIAVPLGAQGHLNPLMRFCKALASHGILITFVQVEYITSNDTILPAAELHDTESNIRRLRIPLRRDNQPAISIKAEMDLLDGLRPLLVQQINRLSQEGPPVSCIISDIVLSSITQEVAATVNLPLVAFNTCSQSVNLFYFYISNGDIPLEEALNAVPKNNADLFQYSLPGLPPLRNRDLPRFEFRQFDQTEYMYGFACRQTGIASKKADMIVVNSLEDLEGSAFKVMSREVPIYPIGPLIEELSGHINTSVWKEQDDCLDWLDKQPPNSVLYISLGSSAIFSNEEREEILHGLEASHQRFLWVLGPDEASSELPEWFTKSTKDRSYIVSWAPQVGVLGKRSVGGFLTHCGWNSTIEAVAKGVPMLCWPYFSDQFMDCKLVVEEWKVGMRLREGEVGRGEVEKMIRSLMEGEEGTLLRSNASRLSQASSRALQPGGSSHAHMKTVIQRLTQHTPQL